MNLELFLLEIKNMPYDRLKLLEVFNHAKGFARLKGLKWRTYSKSILSLDKAKCLVIQHGDNMMLDDTKKDLSYDFLQHDYIKSMVAQLNLSHEISPGNLDIIWYRPGFVFEPHVDHYAYSTMMWPIFPEDGGQPIDFYYKEGLEYEKGKSYGFQEILTDNDIVHTHYYNSTYPAVFNSHWIHGVRLVKEERVFLRLRINESFESLVEKYKNGTLVK